MTEIRIYTDGACSGNPGPGGWGVLIIENGDERTLCGGADGTTNNRMELTAAIEALNAIGSGSGSGSDEGAHITLLTDSTYVKDGITKWLQNWKKRGWKTAAKKPVKNIDLWKALDAQAQRHHVKWAWVKGHSGDAGNERADALACQGMEAYK